MSMNIFAKNRIIESRYLYIWHLLGLVEDTNIRQQLELEISHLLENTENRGYVEGILKGFQSRSKTHNKDKLNVERKE